MNRAFRILQWSGKVQCGVRAYTLLCSPSFWSVGICMLVLVLDFEVCMDIVYLLNSINGGTELEGDVM